MFAISGTFVFIIIRFSMKTIGERILHLRKQAELTQSELAKKVKISHTQMARYEIKGVQPPADVLKRIADALNSNVEFLIYGDKDAKVKASLKDNNLLNQFKAVELMPEEDRLVISKLIDAFITKKQLQLLVN